MTENQMTEHDSPSPRARSSRGVLGFLIFLGLLVAVLYVVRPQFRRSVDEGAGYGTRHHSVGTPLRRVELQPLVNASQPLTLAELRGKVILINFWGPWCPPCRMEMPHLVELQRMLADRDDFSLVSVSCGYSSQEELKNETEKYARGMGIEFPIYSDASDVSRSSLVETAKMESFGFPTSVLLDRNHVIRGVWLGFAEGMERELKAVVTEVLGDRQAS